METTVGNLKIGERLVLGGYGVSNEEPYPIVWLKGTPNCDFITDKVIDFLCFDAPERQGNGYGIGLTTYERSNIFSFLNSDLDNWYCPTHEYDHPPVNTYPAWVNYKNHYGFLYYFEEHELSVLVDETYSVDEVQVHSRIRLPSAVDICGDTDQFYLFRRKGIRANPTEDFVQKKGLRVGIESERSFATFWVSGCRDIQRSQFMTRQGIIDDQFPCKGAGLRPVCTVSPSAIVELMDNGMYRIKPFSIGQNTFTDNDLYELLGMTQSAISHQLRVLKQSALVKFRRDGKTVYYSLADTHVATILAQGLDHVQE